MENIYCASLEERIHKKKLLTHKKYINLKFLFLSLFFKWVQRINNKMLLVTLLTP
jgi:hypothetical protein